MSPSLIELLGELPDPRDRRGIRYPLVPVLALCLVATLAGHTSLAAISQFGRLRKHRLAQALGFKRGTIPAASTLSDVLRDLDAEHLDRLIGRWLASRHDSGWEVINLDGKTARGSRDGEAPGAHLLAAYAPQASAVIAQLRVDAKTNEHKAALRLLGILPPLVGTVVTADAMFTHADVCAAVLEQQGEYVLYAKKNQPQLQADLEATFAAAASGTFSPLPAGAMGPGRSNGDDAREGARADRGADHHHHHVAQRVPGLAAGGPGVPTGADTPGEGEDDGRGGVRDHQPQPDGGGRRVVIGPDASALVDRERFALRARCDLGRGPLPGPQGERPAGAGVGAERGRVPAQPNGRTEHRCRHTRDRRRPREGHSLATPPNFDFRIALHLRRLTDGEYLLAHRDRFTRRHQFQLSEDAPETHGPPASWLTQLD